MAFWNRMQYAQYWIDSSIELATTKIMKKQNKKKSI